MDIKRYNDFVSFVNFRKYLKLSWFLDSVDKMIIFTNKILQRKPRNYLLPIYFIKDYIEVIYSLRNNTVNYKDIKVSYPYIL